MDSGVREELREQIANDQFPPGPAEAAKLGAADIHKSTLQPTAAPEFMAVFDMFRMAR